MAKLDDSAKMEFKMTVLSALNDLLYPVTSFSETSDTQFSTLSSGTRRSTMNAISEDYSRHRQKITGKEEISNASYLRGTNFQYIEDE